MIKLVLALGALGAVVVAAFVVAAVRAALRRS
jgi:hypothetical protein